MKLLFTGDINFRGKDNVTFEESEKILTEVLPYAKKSDFVIPNLECPLADKEKHKPIKKSGPNLICAPENICFLKALNTDAVIGGHTHCPQGYEIYNGKPIVCRRNKQQGFILQIF